jgi:hypothetical protein
VDDRPSSNTSESPTQMTSTENGPHVPHVNLPSASRNTNTSPLTNPSNGRSSKVSEVVYSSEQGVPYERTSDRCYLSVPVTKEVRTLVMDEELFNDGYYSDGQVGLFFSLMQWQMRLTLIAMKRMPMNMFHQCLLLKQKPCLQYQSH